MGTLIAELIEEKNDLEVKLARIEVFITTTAFKDLSYVEKHLLLRQKTSMTEYLNVLRARVSLYEDFSIN